MKYPRIISKIASTKWAMTEESFSGMIGAIKGGISSDDYALFHLISEDEKQIVHASIGDPLSETSLYSYVKGSTGFIFIDGPIIPKATAFSDVSGLTSIDVLTNEFSALEARKDINQIVFVLDTPGGAINGISEFSQTIKSSKKPTVAYVFGMAASAGYWIASATDKIISSDTGLIGSIGTIATIRISEDENEINIISSQSPKKRTDIKTKEGKAEVQKIVDALADVFINAVATNRGITSKEVIKDYGQGGVMVASPAMKAGLIDGISTLKNLMGSFEISKSGTGLEIGHAATLKECTGDSISNLSEEAKTEFQASIKTEKKKKKPKNKRKEKRMTLEELLAENPEAKMDLEKIKASEFKKGAESIKAVAKEATVFLNSEYPSTIKEMAARCIAGEVDLFALQGTVAAFDTVKEQLVQNKAEEDTEDTEETTAQKVESLSDDGVCRTAQDEKASVERIRSMRGLV